MPIPRILQLCLAACIAAAMLAACKGGGSGITGPTALLRIVQGNPALGSVDYQFDNNGTILTGAAATVVQPFQIVSAAAHTVQFFVSGTKNQPTPNQCSTPALLSGVHYTLVVAGAGCILFQEPGPINGTVVYHNATSVGGGIALYPVFCQPAGATPAPTPQPCTAPVVQSTVVSPAGGVSTAPAAVTPVTVGVGSYPTATSGLGIAFTAAASATSATPLCYSATADPPTDPTLYPVTIDPTDTTNFVPNGSNDQSLAIFVTDGATQTGANACPIALSGSISL